MSVPEFPALRINRYRDTWSGQVLADRVDSEVRLSGWVHRRRDHGGLVFIDLRDRTGLVQLLFHPDESGEAFELSHSLRAEDIVSVGGRVVRRDPNTINAELDQAGRSLKGQMKHADRVGARRAVILEQEGGASVRDMESGEQRELDLARVVEEVSAKGEEG